MLTAAAAESEATWGEGERTWLPPTWSTAETGDNETSLNLLMLLVAAAGGGNGRESAPEDTDGLLLLPPLPLVELVSIPWCGRDASDDVVVLNWLLTTMSASTVIGIPWLLVGSVLVESTLGQSEKLPSAGVISSRRCRRSSSRRSSSDAAALWWWW
jgi:hypothetical protein